MAQLKYKTRDGSEPWKKQGVYLCCHPDDLAEYLPSVSQQIFATQDCAIWYTDDGDRDKEFWAKLKQMRLFVIPVTRKLLDTKNTALDTEFPFALNNKIVVLPLLQETGLEKPFTKACGDLQFFNHLDPDPTAIPYHKKLEDFLASIFVDDATRALVKKAFSGHIFLSYRKKDRKYALQLMKLIHDRAFCRDIAIWYDEFLRPGEDFNDAIKEAIELSQLFALAVTPNLVNETNYVMQSEFPHAKNLTKPMLPVELVPTDRQLLQEEYRGIPAPVEAGDADGLSRILQEAVTRLDLKSPATGPEHDYLIGLAYLNGIDMEIDGQRAEQLLLQSAEAGYRPAMQTLLQMYTNGNGVGRDYPKAIAWKQRLNDQLLKPLLPDLERLQNENGASYGGHATREQLEVAYARSRALKMLKSITYAKVSDWCTAQQELAKLYLLSGDTEGCRQLLTHTISFLAQHMEEEFYSLTPKELISQKTADATVWDLHVMLLDCFLEARQYDSALSLLKNIASSFRIEEQTDRAARLLYYRLTLKHARILYEQGSYGRAYAATEEIATSFSAYLGSCLSQPSDFDDLSGNIQINSDGAISLSGAASQLFSSLAFLSSSMDDLYAFTADHGILAGKVAMALGDYQDALDNFRSAIRGDAQAGTLRDPKKELLCHILAAQSCLCMETAQDASDHLTQAETILNYRRESTVDYEALRRDLLITQGDGAQTDPERYYRRALDIARTLVQDAPTPENACAALYICARLWDTSQDGIEKDALMAQMQRLAQLDFVKTEPQVLGQMYYAIGSRTHDPNTLKKTGVLFRTLAEAYPHSELFHALCLMLENNS